MLSETDRALDPFRKQATVVAVSGRCSCGCPTIDLAVDRTESAPADAGAATAKRMGRLPGEGAARHARALVALLRSASMETNALYFGDNLNVLSERLPDGTYRFPSESVDLVYLDPPFNSQRDYSLIFKETGGGGAEAQIKAFEDTSPRSSDRVGVMAGGAGCRSDCVALKREGFLCLIDPT